jgi:hypothetical protein
MADIRELEQFINSCSKEQRYEIFKKLRQEFAIHPIEAELNTRAEVILDAIHRASDLTLRGIRGIIAECTFALDVVQKLQGWEDITPKGDHSYDFLLKDAMGQVRVQVKMQRQEKLSPKIVQPKSKPWNFLPRAMYVVETQRTRGGKNLQTGEKTRPYVFGQFDILAVSLHPSTKDWSRFLYTVTSWLLPTKNNPNWLQVLQPVPQKSDEYWTDDFLESVRWLRSGIKKRLYQE